MGSHKIKRNAKNEVQNIIKCPKRNYHPNAELDAAAVAAREAHFKSYGKMQAEQYASLYTSDIRQEIALKRKSGEYRTVRERMAEKKLTARENS